MNNSLKLFCAALIAIAGGELYAQEAYEVEVGEVQTDDGNTTFGSAVILEASQDFGDGTANSSMRIVAAEPGTTMAFATDGGDFMHFGAGGDSFSLLNNKSIQKDLELVEDQMESIRAVQSEFGKKIRDQIGDISKGNFDPERMSGLKDIIAEIQAQKKEEINKLLLPHQQDRLRQVALQMKMKSRGTSSALTSDEVAEELGITVEQIEELKERAKKLQKEIEEKTNQLKENAKQELIGILTPAQQKKLKEMIGDEYKPEPNDWQSRIPGRVRQRINRSRSANDGN